MIDAGEVLAGRYRLVSRVGTGAMGVVWKAHDERLHRVVAVKQLLAASMSEIEAEEANRRALREGRITARLHHPHAIAVYNVAEHDGTPYLIMEYLPSQSLSTVLAERGPLSPAEAARIGSQIAAALAAAHAAGIVHSDIKPGNVLLADDGTAKITDFGISRAVGDGTGTATGILGGTPAYLAPEFARGQRAGFAADVFSLGSTLYAAVEGVPPFGLDGNALALLFRIGNSEITPPQRSGPLTPVLARLLDRDLSRRPTMEQAQEALAQVAAATPSPRTGAPHAMGALAGTVLALWSPTEGATRPPRSTAALVFVAASLLMVGIMVVAAVSYQGSSTTVSGASPPSTTPGTTQHQQAPRPSPTVESTPRAAPVLAPRAAPNSTRSSKPSPTPNPQLMPSPKPNPRPSPTPSPSPSPTPGPSPSSTPGPSPSSTPGPTLSSTPGPTPSSTSSPEPSPSPSPEPSTTPSPSPSSTPSSEPNPPETPL